MLKELGMKCVWLYFIVICFACACVTKAYSDNKLEIAPEFVSLFNAVSKTDSMVFKNPEGATRVLWISTVDSIVSNSKGGFINEEPYKLLRLKFKEKGQENSKLDRENELFINKEPSTGKSSLCISLDNLYYYSDSIAVNLVHDSLIINGRRIDDYYFFESSLQAKNQSDIQSLYMTQKDGIVKFITHKGESWVRRW